MGFDVSISSHSSFNLRSKNSNVNLLMFHVNNRTPTSMMRAYTYITMFSILTLSFISCLSVRICPATIKRRIFFIYIVPFKREIRPVAIIQGPCFKVSISIPG